MSTFIYWHINKDYWLLCFYGFVTDLEDVANKLAKLNITFHLHYGKGEMKLPLFVKKNKIGIVVLDFHPMRGPVEWARKLCENLKDILPVYQVLNTYIKSRYHVN